MLLWKVSQIFSLLCWNLSKSLPPDLVNANPLTQMNPNIQVPPILHDSSSTTLSLVHSAAACGVLAVSRSRVHESSSGHHALLFQLAGMPFLLCAQGSFLQLLFLLQIPLRRYVNLWGHYLHFAIPFRPSNL